MASGETIRQSYEYLPLLSLFVSLKKQQQYGQISLVKNLRPFMSVCHDFLLYYLNVEYIYYIFINNPKQL